MHRALRDWKIDLVILDIMLPGHSGLDLMKSLQEKIPDLKVIFITASDSDLYLVESLRYGAAGYLSKDSSKELIELSIRGALAGGVILAAPLVNKAFGAISQAASQVRAPGSAAMVELSTREIDVLRLVAQGKSDNQIRKDLNLGEHEIWCKISNFPRRFKFPAVMSLRHKISSSVVKYCEVF